MSLPTVDEVGRGCVAGMCCPKCGQFERFFIVASIICDVHEEGSEPAGDHVWEEESYCRCGVCHEDGIVKDFYPQLARCGECEACKYVEDSKRVYAPNPPFSHATQMDVDCWNKILTDNPCKTWREVE